MSQGRRFGLVGLLALSVLSTATAASLRAGSGAGAADTAPCCTVSLSQLHLPSTYSTLISTTLVPPAGYAQTAPGVWSGPPYRLAAKPNATTKASTLKWWVKLDHTSG